MSRRPSKTDHQISHETLMRYMAFVRNKGVTLEMDSVSGTWDIKRGEGNHLRLVPGFYDRDDMYGVFRLGYSMPSQCIGLAISGCYRR